MKAGLFLRAALVALDEAGDPLDLREHLEDALNKAEPLKRIVKPAARTKRVEWCIAQLAMFADDPARAYARLQQLCIELFDPIAGQARVPAPAPEVAMTMTPEALVEAIMPAPRVLARELAAVAELDSTALMKERKAIKRILGVRSIPLATMGRFAEDLAARIADDADATVRTEALAVAMAGNDRVRAKIAAALGTFVGSLDPEARVAALDAMRTLKMPLADERLVELLVDPVPAVRAAAARSIGGNVVAPAVVGRLADEDASVRAAALEAVARTPSLHTFALVPSLIALVRRHDSDTRAALYLLGKLAGPAQRAEVIATLHECATGSRSDVGKAAELVLGQLGEKPVVLEQTRMLRAARELAASDRETQVAGLLEAQRLGAAAKSLVPAIRRLGEAVAGAPDAGSRATFSQVRDVLAALGVPNAELPRAKTLEPWKGIVPREREVHGAYAIAAVEGALGVWDHATGAMLFVVEHAELMEFLAGRAEVGVLRIAGVGKWFFERYAVPKGKRTGSLAIPKSLARGSPASLASAAGLVTVWCNDDEGRYGFHIKIGVFDILLDDEPNVDKRKQK